MLELYFLDDRNVMPVCLIYSTFAYSISVYTIVYNLEYS